MGAVSEAVAHVDGVRVFYRLVEGEGAPAVFVHGSPTHSEDWLAFLERLEGPAVALDLPGWGFSERPDRSRFDYSMEALGTFVERFLDALEIEQHSLVVHDWGAIALIAAQRHPGRLRRLVVINAMPLLSGYRWHRLARWFWRRRLIGELANAAISRPVLRLLATQAGAGRGGIPGEFVDYIRRGWPAGTWPEMLALYRSGDPARLAANGARLGELRCPALVVWGRDDPYIPTRFGRAYAECLPNAELVELHGAGHWPWLDRPEVIDRTLAFLAG